MLTQTLNSFGIDKENPHFFTKSSSHKERPGFLRTVMEKCKYYYFSPKKYLPRIEALQARQKRSERRESIAASCQILLHYTDLETLEIGTPTKSGEINSLRIGFVGNKIKMGNKRLQRALSDLRAAKYVYVTYKRVFVKGKIYTVMAIKWSRHFFFDIGMKSVELNSAIHMKQKSIANKSRHSPQTPLLKIARNVGGQMRHNTIQFIKQNILGQCDNNTAIYDLMREKNISPDKAKKLLSTTPGNNDMERIKEASRPNVERSYHKQEVSKQMECQPQ